MSPSPKASAQTSLSLLQHFQSKVSSSINWRTQAHQTQLVSQLSTVLLQRRSEYWTPILKTNLKLSKLAPSLFLQVLQRIQTSPEISLDFFNWTIKNLDFKPDLKTQSKLISILFESGDSGLSKAARPILDSVIEAYPSTQIVSSLCKAANFSVYSPLFCYVLESYCFRGLFLEALDVYCKAKELGHVVISGHGCNVLLNLLQDKNEIRLAWCFYASLIRNGVPENQFTWSILSRMLCKDGNFEKIAWILDRGIRSNVPYNLLIECYSERGNFDAAFGYLAKMHDMKLESDFSSYSSILDGACRYGEAKVIDMVLCFMIEKKFISEHVSGKEYDIIIQKLSDLGRTYAAGLYLDRAHNEKVELQDATCGCMLRSLSDKNRIHDAIQLYAIVSNKKLALEDSCYSAFVKILCKQMPSFDVTKMLKEMIQKGFHPSTAELSRYIRCLCDKCVWAEAGELLNMILDRGFLLDPSCYFSLIKHYCRNGQVDAAVTLHNKVKLLNGTFDVKAYNLLLSVLFRHNRPDDAEEVFDYMRLHKVRDSESFVCMINELCHVKDLRKAMKLHDEMLNVGLKPDLTTYKRLISGFR